MLVISEDDSVMFRGKLYEDLATLLLQQYSTDQIIELLAEKHPLTHIHYALIRLEQNYLMEANNLPQNQAAYWSGLQTNPQQAVEKLQNSFVTIRTLGSSESNSLQKKLADYHVTITADESKSTLTIIITDDYLHPDITLYNQIALQNKRSWLLCRPNGFQSWTGPLFIPGKTACYSCLAQRLEDNYVEAEFINDKTQLTTTSKAVASLPGTLDMAYNLTAIEIVKYLAVNESSQLMGKILSIDSRNWQMHFHTVWPSSSCPMCTGLSSKNQSPALITLQSRIIVNTDGGYRSVPPEVTIDKYKHLISPITGIVSYMELTLNDKIHVYSAGKKQPKNLLVSGIKNKYRVLGCGKGANPTQAKASALCEAIERFCGIFQGNEPRIKATFADLKTSAIHPNDCMLFSDKQYSNTAKKSKYAATPLPFDINVAIDWTPVYSLTHQKEKYLPTEYLYYNYRYSSAVDNNVPPFCYADSNGNAAGCYLEEAILQGLFELIERDCVALWWYNRLQKPAVVLDSFNLSYVTEMQGYYASLNRELWAIDITSDLGIPTIVVLSQLKNSEHEAICFGLGCHWDVKIALERALTEMNQMLTSYKLAQDGITRLEVDYENWFNTATIMNQPYLVPDKNSPVKTCSDYIIPTENDLLSVLNACINILKNINMEILVLDQTRNEIGLNVVKVIVPGLRHFWARFASGRLYDVPVQMNWLRTPLTEEQLNPIICFL